INPLIAQAKVDMDSIKTNAQLTEQESSEALAEAKATAKAALDSYKDLSLYRNEQKILLNSILTAAKLAIDTATDFSEIDVLLTQAKVQMDEVKTDAQLIDNEQEDNQPDDDQSDNDQPTEEVQETNNETEKTSSAPHTGESLPIGIMVLTVCSASAVMGCLIIKRRKTV
ncbi:MAG: hypothetical protein K0R90_630, partial [Oscillospiraceae bacterium]|nr:hypothetical protein [Oscillospiraceae bacterium]